MSSLFVRACQALVIIVHPLSRAPLIRCAWMALGFALWLSRNARLAEI